MPGVRAHNRTLVLKSRRGRRTERVRARSSPLSAPWVPVILGVVALVIAVGAATDVAQAFSQPSARGFSTSAFSCLRAAVMLAFAAFTFNRDAPARRARNPLAYISCFLAMGAVLALRKPTASTPDALVLAGDLVALAFYTWVLASVLTLKHCFGLLPEARGLVTHGPYRFVRHPVYLGELGSCAGLIIAAPSPFNFLLFLVFVLAQRIRMGFEERALTAAFPEYARYAADTPRVCPSPLGRRHRRRTVTCPSSLQPERDADSRGLQAPASA